MSDKITVPAILRRKQTGEKVVMVTCYDYPTALLLDEAGVDVLLVGDSLGSAVLGYGNTLPVTLDDMIRHAAAVRRGTRRGLLVADMPFLTVTISPEDAIRNAGRLMQEAGVEAVKVEGGASAAPTVARLVAAGIAVVGHIGLTPQSVNVFGGYRMQGKDDAGASRLLSDAAALADAGVFAIVLELIPGDLARTITASVPVPTIGIGAGPHCDGQVQVIHDMIGMYPDQRFRHVRRYAEVGAAIRTAAERFAQDVRSGSFAAATDDSDARKGTG
jgi:3-methyl-2-oxobutanoate hydroxymethyltransferase